MCPLSELVPQMTVTKDGNSNKSESENLMKENSAQKPDNCLKSLSLLHWLSEAKSAPVGHAKQELPHRANPLAHRYTAFWQF